ncbi:hypothetical protein [Anaerospora hongkongensis]|uniref:hypothetical protein n=1 Tax=Anaerospora hongkongensis TaxID=244830 RepID=UPI00289F118D|nr:hypothetical protein [Anaerospora hongkongensis]
MRNHQRLTRAALLLAIMLIFQSIRLFVPVPPFISMFVIGSAVNACLLLAVERASWRLAIVLAVIAPGIAYLQQVLPLPIFILPVAAANSAYVLGYYMGNRFLGYWPAVGIAALAKAAAMFVMVTWVVQWVDLPAKVTAALSAMFGWPQLITGLGGGIIGYVILKRLAGGKK